jgi:hypothetical protein
VREILALAFLIAGCGGGGAPPVECGPTTCKATEYCREHICDRTAISYGHCTVEHTDYSCGPLPDMCMRDPTCDCLLKNLPYGNCAEPRRVWDFYY